MSQRALAIASIVAAAIIVAVAILYYFFGPKHRQVQNASSAPVVGKAQVGQPRTATEGLSAGQSF